MFSTSSPTYPASVNVVASTIANGTLSKAGQRLCQKGLSCSGRSDQQDVGFLQFDIGLLAGHFDALVVVVNRDSKLLFGFFLADDVLIEESFDLGRLGQVNIVR